MSIASLSLQSARQSLFSRIDLNKDDKVSEEEFVSGRPKDVSEAQAKSLFGKIDAGQPGGKTGAVSEDQLKQGLEANRPAPFSASLATNIVAALLEAVQRQDDEQEPVKGADAARPSLSDIFKKLDGDSNGTVSREEFIDGRPEGVSEAKAQALFDSIDSEGKGEVTQAQFEEAAKAAPPPRGGPPPGGGGGGGSSNQVYEKEDTNRDGKVSAQEKLVAEQAKAEEKQKEEARRQPAEFSAAAQSYASQSYGNLGSSSLTALLSVEA